MKKFSVLLVTTALISLPQAVKAEPYVGIAGGASFGHEDEISTTANQGTQFDLGWGALGTAGYKFGTSGLRTELELGYRANGIDDIEFSPVTGGDLNMYTVMVNALYDFNLNSKFKPYIGVGAGVAWIEFDNVRTISGSSIDDTETAFAAQGIVGASYALSDRLDFFTQYQYLHAFDVEANTASGIPTDSEFGNSLLTAGLRYTFGVPSANAAEPFVPAPVAQPAPMAPAPEPVAAPVPQKYMVFFDWNRSDITIEAADILKTVADNVKRGQQVQLDLTGHADRSGPDGYNQKLSQKRADAVKKHLIRLGVSATDIETFAKGESSPLVSTDDGVREPQNRRVEIVFGK